MMTALLSLSLFAAALLGLAILFVTRVALARHLRGRPATPSAHPGITVLKPLCGVDDDLWRNLESFARLDYPSYEVLLGVRDRRDPAYALARRAAARWPAQMRVVLQRGEPGFNPKVNQLLTLEREARFAIVVVSDSNIRVPPGYLSEIAAELEDPRVGLVTHVVAGVGARRLGSAMDNLHHAAHVAPGLVGAKRLAGRDVVMGKSMAMRRADIAAMGGFAAVKDVLAEDYVLGVMVGSALGKRVAIARTCIENVSQDRPVRDFFNRYQRWSVLQRKLVGAPVYASQVLLNPVFLAIAAFLAHPTASAGLMLASTVLVKAAFDQRAARLLREEALPLWQLAALPLKDLVFGVAWLAGLVKDEVNWRGNRLRVLAGSRLALADASQGAVEATAEGEVAA